MRANVFKHSVRWSLISIFLGATINGTMAGSFARECAARDLQILTLIEEGESADVVAAERLSNAMQSMMEARMLCYEGRVADAIALYDSIAQDITSDTLLSAQRR
ncbi:MAG TPA: hypothetical protein VGN55_01180 [Xanthobacteraceae bacterium]|jgi:hypothetical protein